MLQKSRRHARYVDYSRIFYSGQSFIPDSALKCRSRGWCATDPQPPVSTGADRDLQLQPGRTQLLGDIFGEIQKPLVRKQLSFGKWDVKGAMTGQARRVLRLQTTAAGFASIAHGSSQAAWFAVGARVWLRSGHGANSAISPS